MGDNLVLWVLSGAITCLCVILLAIGNRFIATMDRLEEDVKDLRETLNTRVGAIKEEVYVDFSVLRDRVATLEGRLTAFLQGANR